MDDDPQTEVPSVDVETHGDEATAHAAAHAAAVAAAALMDGEPTDPTDHDPVTNGRPLHAHNSTQPPSTHHDDVHRSVLGVMSHHPVDPRTSNTAHDVVAATTATAAAVVAAAAAGISDTHNLDPATDPVAITHADGTTAIPPPTISELIPGSTVPEDVPPQPPVKKKRKTYTSEEERRQARILKNRRTAEESRQRRVKKMKDLEEYVANAAAREKHLQEELRTAQEQLETVTESLQRVIQEKDTELAIKDAEIQRLQEKLEMK